MVIEGMEKKQFYGIMQQRSVQDFISALCGC